METTLSEIPVCFVRADGGAAGAKDAFAKLEAKLGSLKGRRFYVTLHRGEYRACVARERADDGDVLGLEAGVIPGGSYATARIYDWQRMLEQIHQVFLGLHEGGTVDESRPDVEHYRSERKLVCFLPIR